MMGVVEYPEAWISKGDVTGVDGVPDGIIDVRDITLISMHYKMKACKCPICDLDKDGWISILDVERAAGNFGLTYEKWLERVQQQKSVALLVSLSPLFVGGVLGKIE